MITLFRFYLWNRCSFNSCPCLKYFTLFPINLYFIYYISLVELFSLYSFLLVLIIYFIFSLDFWKRITEIRCTRIPIIFVSINYLIIALIIILLMWQINLILILVFYILDILDISYIFLSLCFANYYGY